MTLQAPAKPFDQIVTSVFDDLTLFYPDGDGKPMAESPLHSACMTYGLNALTAFYAADPNVYVMGNNFVYYEQNNPRARVSPDLYVVFGVPKEGRRDSFFTWREGATPALVFEFTSRSTKNEDMTTKRVLYEQVLRVSEYILFDPTGDYLRPRLQGFRLTNGTYAPIPLQNDRLFSQVLGLEIVVQNEQMRFFDPVRGIFLEEYQELNQRAGTLTARIEDETRRADDEAARRLEAETENERLRALIAQMTQQNNPIKGEGKS